MLRPLLAALCAALPPVTSTAAQDSASTESAPVDAAAFTQELEGPGSLALQLEPPSRTLGLPEDSEAGHWIGARTWEELCERDRQLSFLGSSSAAALSDVDAALSPRWGRTPALFVLGETRHLPSRPRLRSRSTSGPAPERQAALLGLGAFGPGDEEFLESMIADPDESVARVAVLALARSGALGRAHVRGLSVGEEPLATFANEALDFLADPLGAGPSPAAERLLELRWDGARHYGLVAGREWISLFIQALCDSDRFLEEVIVPEAARTQLPRIHDHLLQHLLEHGGPVITRVVARTMPSELARVIQNELWAPPSLQSWNILLDEIERGRPHPDVVGLLRLALLLDDVRERASLLWIGTGDPEAADLVGSLGASSEPRMRAAVARALGATGDGRWIPELSRLRLDADPDVRAEALVAQVRLGHTPAIERLQGILTGNGPGANMRGDVLKLMGELAYDEHLHPTLLAAMQGANPAETLRIAAVLVEQGVTAPRAIAREALRQGLAGRFGAPIVRGLAQGADVGDLDLLRSLFPAEEELDVNIELARALMRNRDSAMLPILQAALWKGPWHRSHLAAELLVTMRGVHALTSELESPPGGSSPAALRRVGFALGELGGIREVETLARRRRAGDPALQGAYLGALSGRTR